MVKIYTRTGDDGTTGLQGGRRVAKHDTVIEALGELDELNAAIGWTLVVVEETRTREILLAIQSDLLRAGAAISGDGTGGPDDDAIVRFETLIDELEDDLAPLTRFILPGGCEASTRLHLVRAVCRRAERRTTAIDPVPKSAVQFLNRAADLMFVMARHANHSAGVDDSIWNG